MLPELVIDLALDKGLGNIPIVGVYFNAICAKALTWRLGMIFSFLSSRGSEIPEQTTADAMKLIRFMFPHRDILKFVTPDEDAFVRLVTSIEGDMVQEFDQKVHDALEILERRPIQYGGARTP